jgi:hypothetical protein
MNNREAVASNGAKAYTLAENDPASASRDAEIVPQTTDGGNPHGFFELVFEIPPSMTTLVCDRMAR